MNKEAKPFEISNKKNLYNIFLYSNLKDIYKYPKIKEILKYNYSEISECLNYCDVEEFENVVNNKKNISFIDDKLIESFNNYEINDSHIYNLASFFYLTMNVMKDVNELNNCEGNKFINQNNNCNNPLLNKILKNVFYCFSVYGPDSNFDFEKYINLINYLNRYIIINGEGEIVNKQYDIEDFEKTIKNSLLFGVSEELEELKKKIKKEESSKIVQDPSNLSSKELKLFLVPLTKKRHSNTITILISGFLSQKDDINSWQHFYNYDKNNSNYYLFRWPSSSFITLIARCYFKIFCSAELFIQCKKKAKCAGKILALFLASNEEFNNCQINLVGFSLGCQVVKHCVKELERIKGHRDMINNVLFMGGATAIKKEKKMIWRNIFMKNVGGRVINCYSKEDCVLKYLFRLCVFQNPIGLHTIDIKDENEEYDIVENYDFSDIKLGHLDYRDKFAEILGRIKFLNQ